MKLAAMVREARERKDLTQRQLAELVGVSQQAIGQVETGASKRPAFWRKLAAALDLPEESVAELMRDSQRRERVERGSPLIRASGRGGFEVVRHASSYKKIPVMGRVAGSPVGDGHLIIGDAVDRTDCPPWLEDAQDAYALFVVGESMIPRFYPGELIYVHPNRQPRRDDFVVAQIRQPGGGDVFGYVKQFVRMDGKSLVLRQFYPKIEELEFPADSVDAIHKIIIPGLG